jgi:hypothetical protein
MKPGSSCLWNSRWVGLPSTRVWKAFCAGPATKLMNLCAAAWLAGLECALTLSA